MSCDESPSQRMWYLFGIACRYQVIFWTRDSTDYVHRTPDKISTVRKSATERAEKSSCLRQFSCPQVILLSTVRQPQAGGDPLTNGRRHGIIQPFLCLIE